MDENNKVSYKSYDYAKSKQRLTEDSNNRFGKPSRITKEAFDMIEIIVFALVIVALVFTFVFRIVGVSGNSMIYTLSNGDRLVLSSAMYEPKQGDIVVCCLPEQFTDPIIKRVIANEGQTVNITNDGKVSVDNKVLNEPYIHDPTYALDSNVKYPLVVPKGEVFIMGDNRINSRDSRSVGSVDKRSIIGKAVFRIMPFGSIGPMTEYNVY